MAAKRKRFNKENPGWKDGILRFRCPSTDLWRRYHETVHGAKGPTKGWELDGEVATDSIGEYMMAKNNTKVYTFPKPIRLDKKLVMDDEASRV